MVRDFCRFSVFSVLLVVGASFCFGLGLSAQIFQTEEFKEVVSGPFCPNGRSVISYSHHLKSVRKGSLLELGEDGRATLKNCLCHGFKSGTCTALKMEINDDILVSTDF